MFVVILLGNSLLIIISILDSRLPTPMYFLLGNLSFLYICYTSSFISPMLTIFRAKRKSSSSSGSALQMVVSLGLGSIECVLLGVMAYDQHVATCNPLRYPIIMNRVLFVHMAAWSWIIGCRYSLVKTVLTMALPFCGNNIINHLTCEILALLKLICSDISMNVLIMMVASTVALMVYSSFATGPRQSDGTFYEFRTYSLKPSKMNQFLENFKKNVHLRTAHSELVGYWSVEFGGRMNKAFHIWKYDNFAHRIEVRKALAKDKEWQEQFLIPNLALMDKQESEITYLVPWCKLEKPPKEGVYELVTFQMKPGGPAVWGDTFKKAINAHVILGYSKLVGVFHTEYGALNRVHVLWWNESADSRAAGRHKAHEDPRVVAAVRECVNYLVSQQNMLLIPTSFSPLK
ncbi:Protein NipSnap like protein 3A [Myotis davidii]|uniref:Protein NipSnap like protein 3A n=1 Tax=Myotis davidii TaxID=225400 RepID=L5LLW7_MYODS|nr:Protein NipSnap like protein 3A [Myotis davidii]